MPELHEDRANELSKLPKIINEQVIWHKLKVRVIAPDIKETLQVIGIIGKTNHSFTLLFQNLPIRRYCNQGRHTSPDGQTVVGPHKHTWDQIHEDSYVYIPDDINPEANPYEQFLQFLSEQNIALNGDYQPPLIG
jgi:hypothetical protein